MRRVLVLLALLFAPTALLAQVRSVEVRAPRAFGYFVGDLIHSTVDIVVDDGFTVDRSSLPRPGPVAYWLDLRNVEIRETPETGARRIRLDLTYQSFYAALDSRRMEVPGFTITVVSDRQGGTTSAKAEVPDWGLVASPLREVQPERRDDPVDYMRPDGRVAQVDIQGPLLRAAIFAGLAALALVLLAWNHAWSPFGARKGRAFAGVLRSLRGLSRRGDAESAYREMLLCLHRGLDATDGRRVLADDLSAFLDRHPAFRGEESNLARFFSASRLAFFGGRIEAARSRWSLEDAQATARRLAAAERMAAA